MTSFAITPESIADASITLVSNDAGGAELVSRLAREYRWNLRAVIGGPAVRIFDEVLGAYPSTNLEDGLSAADCLVTGSGWSSNLEYDSLVLARERGIPSVTILDHWVNYTSRLTRNGILVLPDTFWVTDEDALRLANASFVETPAVVVPNLLFAELREQFAERAPITSGGDRILVVCEPISDHYPAGTPEAIALGYDEVDALSFLLTNVVKTSNQLECITIRPHPSETIEKYAWAASAFPGLTIHVSKEDTIISAVNAASIVAGCESMAMVLGLVANRRVISIIPPCGPRTRLPQTSIEPLVDIVNGSRPLGPEEY